MKKVIFLIFFLLASSLLAEAKPATKYWHRKKQNRMFQKFIQSPKKHGIDMSWSLRPKGDVLRHFNKYY